MSTWTIPASKLTGVPTVAGPGTVIDGQVLDSVSVTSLVASVTLDAKKNQAQKFKRYEIVFDSVVCDIEISPSAGSLLTMYLGDETQWYEGRTYMTGGLGEWAGEPNIAYQPQPVSLWVPQTLNLGFRLTNDLGGYRRLGSNGRATVFSPGAHADAVNVDTKYFCMTQHGSIGGAAGVSAIPSITLPWGHARNSPSGNYFSGDPNGTPFDWSTMMIYHGSFNGAPGVAMHRFLFKMNGGGNPAGQIAGGYFELRGYGPI